MGYRTTMVRLEQDLTTYRRLAARPWETWPNKGYERYYWTDREFAYVYRLHTDRAFVFWRSFGVVACVLAALMAGPLIISISRRRRKLPE